MELSLHFLWSDWCWPIWSGFLWHWNSAWTSGSSWFYVLWSQRKDLSITYLLACEMSTAVKWWYSCCHYWNGYDQEDNVKLIKDVEKRASQAALRWEYNMMLHRSLNRKCHPQIVANNSAWGMYTGQMKHVHARHTDNYATYFTIADMANNPNVHQLMNG